MGIGRTLGGLGLGGALLMAALGQMTGAADNENASGPLAWAGSLLGSLTDLGGEDSILSKLAGTGSTTALTALLGTFMLPSAFGPLKSWGMTAAVSYLAYTLFQGYMKGDFNDISNQLAGLGLDTSMPEVAAQPLALTSEERMALAERLANSLNHGMADPTEIALSGAGTHGMVSPRDIQLAMTEAGLSTPELEHEG